MNAKKITPDETTPEQPAAAEAPDAVDEVGTSSASADVEVTPAGEVAAEHVAVAETAPAAPEATGEVAPVQPPVQTVYVMAPTPPRPKGNRGVGVLLSFVAAIVFAAAYVGVAAVLTVFMNPSGVINVVSTFLTSPLFFVPVLAFLVLMILWALVANRASWWSWVFGSLLVAVATYFVSIGIFLLMQGGFGMTASAASVAFATFALNPALIAAALVARECAIWFGAAIARRGRKVRERNYEAWQAFELEEAQKRA